MVLAKKILFCLLVFSSLQAGYTPKNFNYLLGNVHGLDDALLKMHFTLYQGYVKNTNNILNLINEADPTSLTYGALKRRFDWEYDGMVLHELYFENLGPAKEINRRGPLYQKLIDSFGSFAKWMSNFKHTALIRGIGWVVLYEKEGELYDVWVDDHHIGHLAGANPLVVLDVWEHAYITEFGLDRAKYVDVVMKNLNWEVIEKRYGGGASHKRGPKEESRASSSL